MDKESNVKELYESALAYNLYLMHKNDDYNYGDYINDKEIISGAKIGFISNIMLSIKEDLVENGEGFHEFESKIFTDSLENIVEMIAKKTSNGYKIGNYTFKDAPEVVGIIRHKLAHGNYKLDLKHNRIILNHKNNDITINIDKLSSFVVCGISNAIANQKTNSCKREVTYLDVKQIDRKAPIKTKSEARSIVNDFHVKTVTITSKDGEQIAREVIEVFKVNMKKYSLDPNEFMKIDLPNLKKYLSSYNCSITIDSKKIKDKELIDGMQTYVEEIIIPNSNNIDYQKQLSLIANEFDRRIKMQSSNIIFLMGNLNNLSLLNAIDKTNSTDPNVLYDYIYKIYGDVQNLGYAELVTSLISVFNSLFIYPFDDIHNTKGDIIPNKNDILDFSTLDLSYLDIKYINVNYDRLNEIKDKLSKLEEKKKEKEENIDNQKTNLLKVKGNQLAETKIKASINQMNIDLNSLSNDLNNLNEIYNNMPTDNNYYYNKTIIEGIRNSIAHGNYRIKWAANYDDTKIVFDDIYNDECTFSAEVSFNEFHKMLINNSKIVNKYIEEKITRRGK